MPHVAKFNDMVSMMMEMAWAPFNLAAGFQTQTPPVATAPITVPAKPVPSKTVRPLKSKPDDLAVIATRSVLLRATSSLTQVSTACHDYCERLSQAFTAVRFMEAMSAITRPFFPLANAQTFGFQSWFSGLSLNIPAPNSYWATMAASVGNALLSGASPFLALAPKREIEGGIAMGMAALFVTASAIGFDKI